MVPMIANCEYSDRYYDKDFEYRHVIVPKSEGAKLPLRVMNETEWRRIGLRQSPGWMHYDIHIAEPHVLLFKRPRYYDDKSKAEKEKWMKQTETLIARKNQSLAMKYDRHKKRKTVLKETYYQQNAQSGQAECTSSYAQEPLAAVSHLFF